MAVCRVEPKAALYVFFCDLGRLYTLGDGLGIKLHAFEPSLFGTAEYSSFAAVAAHQDLFV